MQSVTGVVQEVRVKNTAVGEMFDIVVNGAEYGAGKFRPTCKPGDTITFNVTYRGKFANVDQRSIQVGAGDNVTAFPAKVPKATLSTQDIISRQSAYNTAIAWVGVLVQAGALTLPAKVGVRNQIMDEILEKYRDEILGWNTGTIKETPKTDDTTITHEPFTDDSELFE